jgi:hypothetical protein
MQFDFDYVLEEEIVHNPIIRNAMVPMYDRCNDMLMPVWYDVRYLPTVLVHSISTE